LMKMINVFRYLWFWTALFINIEAFGQHYRYPLRSAFLSASAGFPSNATAIVIAENPSLAAFSKGLSVCGYAENVYGIRNLNFVKLAANYGTGRSGGGIILSHLGNINYREVIIGCHYAKSLGAASLGAGFRYNYFHTAGAERESCLDYTISVSGKLSERFFTALSLTNPWLVKVTEKTTIAPCYALSFGYIASESVFAETRFIKEEGRDFQASIALHFQFAGKWIFHTGCWPTTFRPFIGIELRQSKLRVLVNVSYHPALGASPGLLVNYEPFPNYSE
jgi:hypothetical protein